MTNFKWVYIDKHNTLDIELAHDDDLVKAALSPELRAQYHLVATELWVDYTDTRNRLQNLRKKLAEGPPPKLTVVADIGGSSSESAPVRSYPQNGAVVAARPTR